MKNILILSFCFCFCFVCVCVCVCVCKTMCFYLKWYIKKKKIQKFNPRKLYVKQWILAQQKLTNKEKKNFLKHNEWHNIFIIPLRLCYIVLWLVKNWHLSNCENIVTMTKCLNIFTREMLCSQHFHYKL